MVEAKERSSTLETIVTNTLVFLGEVVSLVFYIPDYIYSYYTISQSKKLRAVKTSTGSNEVVYQHVDVARGKGTDKNPYYKDAKSVADNWRIAVERFKHKECLGYREILGEEDEMQPSGKVFQKYNLGVYRWYTFLEIDTAAEEFGRALYCLLERNKKEKGVDNKRVVIFSETRLEWMVAFFGCAKYNLTVVTLYSTLSEEAVKHGIVESEATVLVASEDGLCKIKNIDAKISKLSTVVWVPNQISKVTKSQFPESLEVLKYEEALDLGRSQSEFIPEAPSAATESDICVIMYTSGSTGLPKGVMLTNRNVMATFDSLPEYITGLGEEDTYIGFLPLAHVLELTCEIICLIQGCRIGYSSPHTLSNTGTKIRKGDVGDAIALKPTLVTAVPLIMDRIYKGVMDMVKNMSLPKRILFNFALKYKNRQVARHFPAPIIDFIVFRKIQNSLGGRVRYLLSGGAPLSASTHEFMKTCFSCPVIQGYGLTETTGGVTVVDRFDSQLGQVGGPHKGAAIKLVDWEEGSYRVTDQPNPRGEIVIKSAQVASGYFKLKDKTDEVFIRDSKGDTWFYSGDIGEFDSLGRLKIIDRKKDLVKLATGEYVSLGKVEMLIKLNKYVENVCVYADSTENYTVCIVVPNEKALMELSKELGLEGKSVQELCTNKEINNRIFKAIKDHGQEKKLDRQEMPQRMMLTPTVWTPETGLVTDSFKLKRKELAKTYASEFASMYRSQ